MTIRKPIGRRRSPRVIISQMMMPKAHASERLLYMSWDSDSGDIQRIGNFCSNIKSTSSHYNRSYQVLPYNYILPSDYFRNGPMKLVAVVQPSMGYSIMIMLILTNITQTW